MNFLVEFFFLFTAYGGVFVVVVVLSCFHRHILNCFVWIFASFSKMIRVIDFVFSRPGAVSSPAPVVSVNTSVQRLHDLRGRGGVSVFLLTDMTKCRAEVTHRMHVDFWLVVTKGYSSSWRGRQSGEFEAAGTVQSQSGSRET